MAAPHWLLPSTAAPPRTYNVTAGIRVADGGSTATFGAGTFNFGSSLLQLQPGTAGYSICNTGSGSLTFGGPSTFVLAGGVYRRRRRRGRH